MYMFSKHGPFEKPRILVVFGGPFQHNLDVLTYLRRDQNLQNVNGMSYLELKL
jgi:hypothetical protein